MENPLVSVIIPVYNASKYLARCLESVCRQKYTNLEIILINDGSTDCSPELCRMYANKDKRIVVLDKPNGGVSAARNDALDAAKGVFVQFVDADDYLDENATRLLVERQQETNADMVIAHHARVYTDKITLHGFIEDLNPMSQVTFAMRMLENPASFYYGVLWNKLYRNSILQENRIRCDATLRWSEDFLFNLQYLPHCTCMASVRTPICYYCKNEDSATANMHNPLEMLQVKSAIFVYYKDLYDSMGLYDDNRAQIYKYLISVAECS